MPLRKDAPDRINDLWQHTEAQQRAKHHATEDACRNTEDQCASDVFGLHASSNIVPLLNLHNRCRISPNPVEAIVLTFLRREDVHHHITVVQNNPTGPGVAFAARRLAILAPDGLFDGVDNGVHLPLSLTGAEHEVIREVSHLAQVEQQDIAGLFIHSGVNRPVGDIDAFQASILAANLSDSPSQYIMCHDSLLVYPAKQARVFVRLATRPAAVSARRVLRAGPAPT